MYHVAEMVRDAKRDMDERYEDGARWHASWAAYTPLPFLYALSGQISLTMQRKAPDLVKRAAVGTRDTIADAVTASQSQLHEWRLVTTRRGQFLFYTVKGTVERVALPAAVAPLRSHVAVPLLNGVEGVAQFFTSEELPELYFVAKNSMTRHVVLRHLVAPPLAAMEGVVRYMVILPSQLVFPSREEVESRTGLFLDESTSRVQSLVEYIYSATEVLDQHWSMVQWNILGRGPYESLSVERRRDVIHSIHQRIRSISSRYKLYEFMASIKLQNEMLYADLLRAYPHCGGVPLSCQQVSANGELVRELEELDQHAFPCWFYRKIETVAGESSGLGAASTTASVSTSATSRAAATATASAADASGDDASIAASTTSTASTATSSASAAADPAAASSSSSSSSNAKAKWIEFPAHENRRLERYYRFYHRHKTLDARQPQPSRVVLVDEGRYEVDLETMEMTPVYWPAVDQIQVRRSLWLYTQRNYGLAPYNPPAATVLEQAFTYYLAYHGDEKVPAPSANVETSSTTTTTTTTTCSASTDHTGKLVVASRVAAAKRVTSYGSLSVPVEGHLVELKGPNDIVQYKRLLAGTTPFTSKRRVYRGDPRILNDPATLARWEEAMAIAPDEHVSTGLAPNADDADIEEEVDHLVLIVHGIGDALKTIDIINVVTLRSIIDCATSLRDLHKEALRSSHFETTGGHRTEFLPIEWHSKLHIAGLDNAIRDVTLPAIPKLREFANDTVLDVLFFMSPRFHSVILEHVAAEMNRVFELFQARNRGWLAQGRPAKKKKKVSIIAHSLGSIISFDLLNHQTPAMGTPVASMRSSIPRYPRSTTKANANSKSKSKGKSTTPSPSFQAEPESSDDSQGRDGSDNDGDDGDVGEAECDEEMSVGADEDTDRCPRSAYAHPATSIPQRSRSDSECLHMSRGKHGRGAFFRRARMTSAAANGVVVQPKPKTKGRSFENHPQPAAPAVPASPRLRRRRRSRPQLKNRKSPRAQARPPRPFRHRGSTRAMAVDPDVPTLAFEVENLFCYGSPVGLFLNVRGQKIDRSFRLPTCKRVFNIYHPYDPVAYRIEPILNPRRAHSKAAIIRTFEGRLRFQYQVRNSFRRMWQKLRQWRRNFEEQVEAAVHSIGLVESVSSTLPRHTLGGSSTTRLYPDEGRDGDHDEESNDHHHDHDDAGHDGEDEERMEGRSVYGRLCQGLPIDYSLQENEIEITNEYLFALTSHVIYWGNRDASLFVAQKLILEPAEDEDEEDDEEEEEEEEEEVELKWGEEEKQESECEMDTVAEERDVAYDEGTWDPDFAVPTGTISPAFSSYSSGLRSRSRPASSRST